MRGMLVNSKDLRQAALIAWFDLTSDASVKRKIRNELWCLRNSVDTAGLSDITMHDLPTKDIVSRVLSDPSKTQDEHSAFILCTIHELS